MKNLLKLFSIAFILVIMAGCEATDLDLQVDPNSASPDQASVEDLFNQIQLTFSNIYQNTNRVPGGTARMYMTLVSYTYEVATGVTTFSGLWFNAYSNLFPDIDALIPLAEERGQDIHVGAAKIMKAWTLMALVDLFDAVPLSEAGQGTDIISPVQDPGSSVYQQAIVLLDEAYATLSGTSAPSPAADLFYGGDASKWATLANTLKIRAAATTRLMDPSGAANTVNSVVSSGDFIDEEAEDFQFNFGSTRTNPNSRHPMYNNHYETGDGDYMNNYYMWLLRADKQDADGNAFIDPRIRFYFYRKVEKSAEQDATTYSCHFSELPDPASTPAHFLAIDPRMPYCIASDDGYTGRDHLNGEGIPPDGPIRTSYGLYPGGGQFDDNTFQDTRQDGTTGGLGAGIYPILLSSFVDFQRAEIALTVGSNDDPRALLESGIRKSIAKVKGFADLVPSTMARQVETRDGTASVEELFVPTDEDIDAYVNFVLDGYDAADEEGKLDILMKEYYIALWGNGLEAYNMYRRTGKPANMQPGLEPASGQFIKSFFYPDVHVNRNANATQKGLTDQVFWDDGSANVY